MAGSMRERENFLPFQGLKNITEVWQKMPLEMIPYKDLGIYRIKTTDEIVQTLEEHQVQLSAMKATRFLLNFSNRDLSRKVKDKMVSRKHGSQIRRAVRERSGLLGADPFDHRGGPGNNSDDSARLHVHGQHIHHGRHQETAPQGDGRLRQTDENVDRDYVTDGLHRSGHESHSRAAYVSFFFFFKIFQKADTLNGKQFWEIRGRFGNFNQEESLI